MNDKRFNYLLKCYLDQTASRGEREELMRLIRKGGNDEALRRNIDGMLLNDDVDGDMDRKRSGEMLKAILSTPGQKNVFMPPARARWRSLAAACILVAALSSAWWISSTRQTPQQLITKQEENPVRRLYSGKQLVRLPDGSVVLLKGESELSYSPSFGEQTREVTLVGEAYFDVQHDPSRPFKVLTGKVTTTVLGTSFNVKAYRDQQEIKVTVTRGKVRVGNDQRTFAILTPDEEIAVNTVTNDFVRKKAEADTSDVWKDLYFKLENVSMEKAAAILGEKYGAKIFLANDDLKMCRISATFLNGEDFRQVLTVVTGVVQATYTILPDGNVMIDGKGCGKNEPDR